MKRLVAAVVAIAGPAALAVGMVVSPAASPAADAGAPTAAIDGFPVLPSHGEVGEVAMSRLIGTTAIGVDGDRVGLVEDVLVDSGGRPVTVLLHVGWYFGVPTKTVAVPVALVRFSNGKDPTGPSRGAEGANVHPTSSPRTDNASVLDELMEGGGGKAVRRGKDGEHVEVSLTRRQLLDAAAFTPE